MKLVLQLPQAPIFFGAVFFEQGRILVWIASLNAREDEFWRSQNSSLKIKNLNLFKN